MASITVSPITSSSDRAAFLKLPWKIYDGNPHWVPPLLMDRRKLMDREKNPFYRHADAEFFLARRNGTVVGRIGAVVNHSHNKEHDENIGFFGFFESVNEPDVADSLFAAANAWLKSRGATAVRGPATPSVNDEYGLLIDGFDRSPVFLMPYNPDYYPQLIEHAGLRKIKDLYAFEVSRDRVMTDRIKAFQERIRQRSGLTFRTLNMKDFPNELARIKLLYNKAWEKNWGSVPLADDEYEALAKDLKPLLVPGLVIFAERNGEPVGFSLSLPDYNVVLKRNRSGYLLPGLYHLFVRRNAIKNTRILVLGVLPEFRRSGAAGVLFYETAMQSIKNGYFDGEAGWVLEDNTPMIRSAELLNAVRTKTYRLYQAEL